MGAHNPTVCADAQEQRALQEAELGVFRAALGECHPMTLMAKNYLGFTLRAQGCLDQARALLEATRREGCQFFGITHPNTVTGMGNLALALFEPGDFKRPHALQRKVLRWRRQILAGADPKTLEGMANLSGACRALTQETQARALDELVLEIHLCNYGDDHPTTRTTLGNLACTINNQAVNLRNAGQLAEAEPLQWEAMAMMLKAYGEDSLQAAIAYSATGALLRLQGDLAQARSYFKKALGIRARELGPEAGLTQLVRDRLHSMAH